MPVEQPPQNLAPDNAERSANRDAFAVRGRVRRVTVPAAPGQLVIDMAAIGMAGRHVRMRVTGNPGAYFFVPRSNDPTPTYPTPDSTALATFNGGGVQTANPPDQATALAAGDVARRYVSPKTPILVMNGVGGAAQLELEDATI